MGTSQQQNNTNNRHKFIDKASLKCKTTSQPLEVGSRVSSRWRDGKLYAAKVLERRKLNAESDDYQYYVHYNEFNRRLDEWVDSNQLELEGDASENKAEDKTGALRKSTRYQNRIKTQSVESVVEEGHEMFDPAELQAYEERTKVKNINSIVLGRYEIDTWYFSPFPPEYHHSPKLLFCEFCLTFFKHREQLSRHMRKCDLKHPPGDEIHRQGSLSMFEVDGENHKIYAQNLCYLAKLFLDHKTLDYDVDNFLFYVLCECDDRGCHMVGYFSKDKLLREGYNLSCILTLPPYQRKGYGNFLIAFSYELSKKEGTVGTPEKPLSDLGKVSYRRYWTLVLLDILQKVRGKVSLKKKAEGDVSIKELSDMTAIHTDDIKETLLHLNLLQYRKGRHVLCIDPALLDRHLKAGGRRSLDVDASKLLWMPYKERLGGG